MEMFLELSSISYIFFALCSVSLVAMETKMQKKEQKKNTKNISSETICSMGLRLCRNDHHINLYIFYVFYENNLFGLVTMAI